MAAPANTVAPAVTGTTASGRTLATTNGTWTDDGAPAFTYQWQADTAGNGTFANITGATSQNYVVATTDEANDLRCVVTDTDSGGATAANSNSVGPVVSATGTPQSADTAAVVEEKMDALGYSSGETARLKAAFTAGRS